ncbi:GTR10 protein, partial [Polyodon spathula]|nr:GTR10 protein [Polyodon spathula]
GGTVLFLSSTVSVLGGLVFGYELGIISGALLQLQKEFHLSCFQQEAAVSALLFGALSASLIGGVLIDSYDRRNSILFSNLLVLGGSLTLVFSGSLVSLVVGRITVGFAMSISSMSCCIFVSEMVNSQRRGMLVSLYEAGVTVGILTAYSLNYVFADTKGGWKYMFGLAIVPSLIQFICILFLPPSSVTPKSVKVDEPAHSGLMQLTNVEESEDPVTLVDTGEQYSFLDLFQTKDNMRTRTLIGLGLVLFQQFTGQPNVLFYASTIFHSVGFQSTASAVLASVGLGIVKVVATLVAMSCADRVGRRALLIGGCIVMSVSVTTIGLLSQHALLHVKKTCDTADHFKSNLSSKTSLSDPTSLNSSFYPTVNLSINSFKWVSSDGSQPHAMSPVALLEAQVEPVTPKLGIAGAHGVLNWITLLSMMAFVSAYSVGFGPMTWLVLSEIFPAGLRGRAFAFTNCFNWAANLIVTLTFLDVIDTLSLSWTFLLYGAIAVAAVVFIYLLLPETKGKSLEEIDKELSGRR